MKSKNLVILVGNVGTAPEVKTLSNETKVANFSVATNEVYTNKNGEETTTTHWHKVVVWGGLAKVVENYVNKGTSVMVEGKLVPKSYKDDNDVTHYTYEVKASDLILCGAKQGQSEEAPEEKPTAKKAKAKK